MRLAAGKQLMRLATVGAYRAYWDPETFQLLAGLLIDPVLPVARGFAAKLYQRIRSHSLPVFPATLFPYRTRSK